MNSILRVVAPYIIFAVMWIVLSDSIVSMIFLGDEQAITRAQTFKGIAFVIASALLIYLALYRELKEKEKRHRDYTGSLQAALRQLEKKTGELDEAYSSVIEGWASALERRDLETGGHTRRVVALADCLAERFEFTPEERKKLERGAMLHDIGKMGIPDAILLKPGPLTTEERQVVQQHTLLAVEMLTHTPSLLDVLEVPGFHHERWDGSGYPHGISGENIPRAARLFAVVDVADAMGSNRPYHKAHPIQQVYAYLRAQSGVLFDPDVVDAFLAMDLMRRTELVGNHYKDGEIPTQ